jgi:hypothetical protein
MTSKIHIRMEGIEVDFEGSEEFVRDELARVLTAVSALQTSIPNTNGPGNLLPSTGSTGGPGGPGGLALTTGSIAAKLSANSGTDLVLASAGRLALVEGRDTYTRQDLLTEMKTAAGYYRTTYSNNLSSYLQTLVRDGKLVETAANTFALAATARAELSSRLAV